MIDNNTLAKAFNGYKIMWLFAMFDLPVETKHQRRVATQFRKALLKDGFGMMQYSIYVRHCASEENAEVHRKRISALVPEEGSVMVLTVTDKQYSKMVVFYGKEYKKPEKAPVQMELF